MIDSPRLLADLQKEVTKLHADLRARCDAEPSADAPLKAAYDAARAGQRTALTYKAWREEELTNVAVSWVLACVFIRFLEDNALVETLYLAGPDAAGIGLARDQQIVFFRDNPGLSDREYLEHAFSKTAELPGMADLFDRRHNPLWELSPSPDAVTALLGFWRKADAESGRPLHDFSDSGGKAEEERVADPTRFLGDLYQDLSEAARKRYALLQTPVFIEQFILDRTLTPAIETFGFREVRMIDPTCGSGHFLLGGFARLFALWNEALPGEVPSVIAQHALDQVFGVDLNPNVVAIARFRLLLAALRVSGVTRLRDAFDFKIHVAAGDSLLHGRRFRASESFTTGAQRTFDTEEVFRDELKHHYEVEDVEALHRILGQQYHAVVGNPPYITVKDRAVSELYRARFPSCHRAYALSVPFMERFFDLAVKGDGTPQQPAGFVGQITANSFMKREFGRKLIEEYLPLWDLTHVIDSDKAHIPGHATPTVILFGKNQRPVSSLIRTVMGIKKQEPAPEDPAVGLVWTAILSQVDQPGSSSEYVSVADMERRAFHSHPWSIGGGGTADLKQYLDDNCDAEIGPKIADIGTRTVTRLDEVFELPPSTSRRWGIPSAQIRASVKGGDVRDWGILESSELLFPYGADLNPFHGIEIGRSIWQWRSLLADRVAFGKSQSERGLPWFAYSMLFKRRFAAGSAVLFSHVATHNHFVIDRHGRPSNRHAPVVYFNTSEEDTYRLCGQLNSSVACFWLKQISHDKGAGGIGGGISSETWERRFEFDEGKLHKFPIPASQPTQLPTALVQTSTALQGQSPAATLASWGGPESGDLRPWLARARDLATRQRRQLIAWQEELDWQIYEAFGLVENGEAASPRAPTAGPAAVSLPEGAAVDAIPPEGLELGQRAFEIVLARKLAAGEAQSTWFERHGSTPITEVPRHWPAPYRELVERRLCRIAVDPAIRLIEQPEYKRRWNTEPWGDAFARAARDWLLLRLETYFFGSERMTAKANDKETGRQGDEETGSTPPAVSPSPCPLVSLSGFPPATRPAFTTTNQLAEIAKTDRAFQAVAEQLMGGPGFSVPKLVRELVESASVPFLPAQRYKPSGLLKRHDWEHVWELQREEDRINAEIEKLKAELSTAAADPTRSAALASQLSTLTSQLPQIPVPPKYASSDFKKSVWWSLRGKLDVPKERWISYPGAERTEDPSPIIAWAGWDAAQQARALAEYYVDAKQTFGFPPEKLTLLLAGLLELQPWLTQWHAETDPTFGVSPAEAIKGFLDAECQALGATQEDLERVQVGAVNAEE